MNDVVNIPKPENPLLARARIPGETFALPSKGIFYTNGEIDDSVKNGEVLVNPMITLDELILKTPDRLINGTGIEEVFKRCVPQVIKPLQLLAKDLDYLMICLRKITYGDDFSIEYEHDCKDAKTHSYTIPLSDLLKRSHEINPHTVEEEYTLTLSNGQVAKLQPPRYQQVLNFYQTYNKDEDEISTEDISNQVLLTSLDIIKTVDGIDDKALIAEWLNELSAGFVKDIGKAIEMVSEWGPELEITIKCKDCGEEITTQISLNPISFFS